MKLLMRTYQMGFQSILQIKEKGKNGCTKAKEKERNHLKNPKEAWKRPMKKVEVKTS